MKSILLMNGPNLDMLGVREPEVYGRSSLNDLERLVWSHAREMGIRVSCFQSNSEGKLIDKIHEAHRLYDGIVYNPGAHTHYSYALRDALGGIDTPCVEVHISDVDSRETFRHTSVTAPACVAQVKGRGFEGYCDAVDLLAAGARTRLGEGFEERLPQGQVIVADPDELEGDAPVVLEVKQAAARSARIAAADDAAAEASDGAPTASEGARTESGSACVVREVSADVVASAVEEGGWASVRRLERLRSACADRGFDAFLARDTASIRWLTAFDGVFDDERAHALEVTADRAVLHTDSRYAQAACKAAAASGEAVQVDDGRVSHAAFAVKTMALRPDGQTAVLAIEDGIALREYRALEKETAGAEFPVSLLETDGLVQKLRAVKDAGEVRRMRAAQAITDAAFSHIIAFMKPGMTEREVQIELEDFMRRHGAEDVAFPSIVATGANGASPHAVPGFTRLEAGQCVVMDFGARALGYCSDMTRTVFLGQPDARMLQAYETLRRANEQVEAMLAPGVTGKEAHEFAEQVLADGGFAGKMGHALGHGVGLDIHEEPILAPRNELPLEAGNVVTVEPGIYLPGLFGMRLEDFGVITETGFDVFTKSTHEMVIL